MMLKFNAKGDIFFYRIHFFKAYNKRLVGIIDCKKMDDASPLPFTIEKLSQNILSMAAVILQKLCHLGPVSEQ